MSNDTEVFYDQHGNRLPEQGWYEVPIFFDRQGAAKAIHASVQTVDRLIEAGRLKAVKIGGGKAGKVLIPYTAMMDFADEAFAPDFATPAAGHVSEFNDVTWDDPICGRVHQTRRAEADRYKALLREGKTRREAALLVLLGD